ncbi:hypothetical protein EYF80_045338 [Liparis tanakae]|uniref:Uncharacterized protein n=1 Tax=Liparis tanakae TaxID=230148 RepID=A0A4Z2FU87_9TELE|nr:hypothetical protein EYF80_045338 [Liparis tanakae]
MEVRLGILGKVKVDDYVDRLDVDAPGEEIYGRKTQIWSQRASSSGCSGAERCQVAPSHRLLQRLADSRLMGSLIKAPMCIVTTLILFILGTDDENQPCGCNWEADDILDEHHEILRQQLVGLRGNGGRGKRICKDRTGLRSISRYTAYGHGGFLPVSSRRMMSSRRLVPPVVAMTLTPPRCLLIWMEIWLTCRASSRVFDSLAPDAAGLPVVYDT